MQEINLLRLHCTTYRGGRTQVDMYVRTLEQQTPSPPGPAAPGRHQSNHRDLLIFIDWARQLALLVAAARTRRVGLELCGGSLPFRCKKASLVDHHTFPN